VVHKQGNPLTVAGAAMALAPSWVVRTMFPFHLSRYDRGKNHPLSVLRDWPVVVNLVQNDFKQPTDQKGPDHKGDRASFGH
jgi:hypothetical protein